MSESSSPLFMIFMDCWKFTLPVPPAIKPSLGRKRAPIWIAIFTCDGFSDGSAWSSSATPPLTTAVDMLDPFSRM